jgi:hypothetical protein
MWDKISRFYPPWLEIFPLALVVFALLYTNAWYDALPSTVPTHFGADGQPDGWSSKSFVSVYLLPLTNLFIYLMMVFINLFLIIRPDDPRRVVNLMEKEKDALGPERLEAIRTFTARGLWLINTLTIGCLAYLTYGSINVGLGRQEGLGWVMWAFFGAFIIVSLGMTIKVLALSSPPTSKKGT